MNVCVCACEHADHGNMKECVCLIFNCYLFNAEDGAAT